MHYPDTTTPAGLTRRARKLITASARMLTAGAILLTAGSATAEGETDLVSAISSGDLLLRMHYRVELADDEANTLDDATASTLRTYMGWQTGKFHDFSVRLAFENVLPVFTNDRQVPGEAPTGFDVVADPDGTEVDEAFLAYSGLPNTTIKLGRQYVTYRKAPFHRFIGTVPWRQNWQSMDGITIDNTSIDGLRLRYAYIDNVNRIFGQDNPNRALANSPMSSHFVNAQYTGLPIGELEGFYYRLDYDNDTLPGPFTDRETFGFKIQGTKPLNDKLKAIYLGEFSHQRAIEDNATAFDSANQYRVHAGLGASPKGQLVKDISGFFGYEVLESDGGLSFSTPLATVHAFQGWADRFIGFPGAGVEDLYFTLKAKVIGDINITAIYHDFSFEAGGNDYGEEFDFQATKKVGKFAFSVKHASYFGNDDPLAGAAGVDRTITWFFVNFVL